MHKQSYFFLFSVSQLFAREKSSQFFRSHLLKFFVISELEELFEVGFDEFSELELKIELENFSTFLFLG